MLLFISTWRCTRCLMEYRQLRFRNSLHVAAIWLLLALASASRLLAPVNACKVVIVSPSSGALLDEGSLLKLSFRIKSSANSSCPSRAAVRVRINGNSVQQHDSRECNSFLPLAATAPALPCCHQHKIEICALNIPHSCAQSTVSVVPAQSSRPWSPQPHPPHATGTSSATHVNHNLHLAAALQHLFPSHEPLIDMSCDAYPPLPLTLQAFFSIDLMLSSGSCCRTVATACRLLRGMRIRCLMTTAVHH